MRFRINQRLVKRENVPTQAEQSFSPRTVLEADNAAVAMRRFLADQNAVVLGALEKNRGTVVATARIGSDTFTFQAAPENDTHSFEE